MDPILQSGRGGLIRETKLPMQELELKMQGGLMREGGRNRGILRYYVTKKNTHFSGKIY